MDHPKDHSLFGPGLPGYIYINKYWLNNCKTDKGSVFTKSLLPTHNSPPATTTKVGLVSPPATQNFSASSSEFAALCRHSAFGVCILRLLAQNSSGHLAHGSRLVKNTRLMRRPCWDFKASEGCGHQGAGASSGSSEHDRLCYPQCCPLPWCW